MKNLRMSVINSRLFRSVVSGITAYALWNLLQHTVLLEQHYTVPVCFYNSVPGTHCMAVPETVHITLRGTKSALAAIDQHHLAFHINAQTCTKERPWIALSESTIFVPHNVRMIYCNPTGITLSS
jgi:hypothetical protein